MNKRYISGCLVLLMLFCELGLLVQPAEAASKVNVALNKEVTVKSEYLEYGSNKNHLVDGKLDTHWSAKEAATEVAPQWIQIDLDGEFRVNGAEIVLKEQKKIHLNVEVSLDGDNWEQVATHKEDTTEQQLHFEFQTDLIRYVRVTIPFYDQPGAWPMLSEIRIFGQQEGREPENITAYDTVNITTIIGGAPVLPTEIRAQYGADQSGHVAVVWDHIDPEQYKSANTFSVNGHVEGATIQPTASVTVQGYQDDFIRGVDISTLTAIEDKQGKFLDSNGTERDLLDILKDRGVNYVRIRLWNDPQKSGGYNDKEDVLRLAKRVKEKGMKILLDFHYSDEWAHPGQQLRPKAWEDLSFDQLKQAVYDYTYEVVGEMKEEGAMPDMVQIGNEINSGVLNGYVSTVNQTENVALLQRGVDAVRDLEGDQHVQIMIHLAEGGQADMFDTYFGELEKGNLDYDVIGLSYYPFWHGTFADVQETMNRVSQNYKKDVVIAETSYPFSFKNGDAHGNIIGGPDKLNVGGATFPATVQGQYDAIAGIMDLIAEVPEGRGAGFFYWEPAWIPAGVGWIASEGDAWENQAMFDYDEFPGNGGYSLEGRALPSLDVYKRGMQNAPADRQHLAAAITRAQGLVAKDFEEQSWHLLAPAIEAAKSVYRKAYTSAGVTQEETNTAIESLKQVMNSMEVIPANRALLEAKVTEAQTYKESDWSAVTWGIVTKALAHATQVLSDPRATQTDVDAAEKRLHDAISGLSDVDKAKLTLLIGEMQQQNASSYTHRSWQMLMDALQAAIVVRDKQSAVQAEVNQALEALQLANEGLVRLQALATHKTATASSSAGQGGGQANSPAGAIDGNTTTSWGTDQSVDSWWEVDLGEVASVRTIEMSMWSGGIKYKIEVSKDRNEYVKVVDTTSDVIVSTGPRHVLPDQTQARYIKVTITAGPEWVGFMDFETYGTFPADKSALETTVNSVAKLQQNDYTLASWNEFSKALVHAKSIIQDEEASVQDVSAANEELKAAMHKLERQDSTPGSGQPSQPTQPSQPSEPSQPSQSSNSGSASSTGNSNGVTPSDTNSRPEKGAVTVEGILTGNGHYAIRPTAQQLNEAIQSMGAGEQRLKLIANLPDNSKAVSFQLNTNQLAEWVRSQTIKSLDLIVGQTSIRIPLKSIPLQDEQTAGTFDVEVSEGSSLALTESQKATIGNRSILNVNVLINGEPMVWTDRLIEVVMANEGELQGSDTVRIVQSISSNGEMKPVTYSITNDKNETIAFKPTQSGSFVITEVQVPLNDLHNHQWAKPEVQNLYGKGIIKGMNATSFVPDGNLTRAQFLQMIIKGMGDLRLPEASVQTPTDVKQGQWYADAVRIGVQMNIIQGRADGTFGANEPVSREDMAVMLNRALQSLKQETDTAAPTAQEGNAFEDHSAIAGYAREAVASMQQLGLLNGMSDGTFAPKQTANRAQGAVAVARLMEQLYAE
ncbi:glycosyl hydrolase 53 family protein [Paenibacillus tundrae]|uniref:Arabinogalactan endo-beta-1,4-galactanase n=1 Tax=Paenibacillus tundrae TaxID=528187 RepID=A0ABT9W8Y6_9BACL|nr:glycosyl hydrolase 53 family protein [Paenibacillus tundrae]MDQ0169733.1 arabinogalactan endo-1,4-beta-galactosidase [Paenibacillus tundrae]